MSTFPGIIGLMLCIATTLAWASDKTSFVVTNARIMTPTGTAQAMAVDNGLIVKIGTDAEVLFEKRRQTTVLDFNGKAVLPGLYDMHVHTLFAGQDLLSCKFPPGARPDVIVDAVKVCAARAKPGEWIVGGSWVDAAFAKDEQHRRLLDAAAPDNPVLLKDESLHSAWVNSLALQSAGISADSENPDGGIIERDAQGEPTGVLRETAARAVIDNVGVPDTQEQITFVKAATDIMLSYGIVGFTDALVRGDSIYGLSEYARRGDLKQYARGCIIWGPFTNDTGELIAERNVHASGRIKFDCVKIVLDGVPLMGRTAALVEPYVHTEGHPTPADHRGMLMLPQHELNEAVARFDALGLQVKFHAAGDGAVRAAIEAIAHARKVNGFIGKPHDIAHNTMIHQGDVGRFRELAFSWEFSPYIWYPTPITGVDVRNAIGPDRFQRIWPVKDALDAGALVVAGSDWPVVPSVNPWLALETLVTRKLPGNEGDAIAAGQRISLDQALRVFTANGAALMGRLDQGGTLEAGKYADFIVLDKAPADLPIGEVHKIEVRETWIAGERVYRRSKSAPQ